jgi:hypothetical protein
VNAEKQKAKPVEKATAGGESNPQNRRKVLILTVAGGGGRFPRDPLVSDTEGGLTLISAGIGRFPHGFAPTEQFPPPLNAVLGQILIGGDRKISAEQADEIAVVDVKCFCDFRIADGFGVMLPNIVQRKGHLRFLDGRNAVTAEQIGAGCSDQRLDLPEGGILG